MRSPVLDRQEAHSRAALGGRWIMQDLASAERPFVRGVDQRPRARSRAAVQPGRSHGLACPVVPG
jgi:hypothetical protein